MVACGQHVEEVPLKTALLEPANSVQLPDPSDGCQKFTIDGQFTEAPESDPGCVEWADVHPCESPYGSLYLDYHNGLLHVLLDWREYVDAPVPDDHYALFRFNTGEGAEQWEIRVHGNGLITILRNGWEYGGIVSAAAGYGASPQEEQEHAIFEFALQVAHGEMIMGLDGPKNPPSNGSPEADLLEDPWIYRNWVPDGLHVFCPNGDELILVSISPPRGYPEDVVVFRGHMFGAAPGVVRMGDLKAEVLNWTPHAITVKVPHITGDVKARVEVGAQNSNYLMFYYDCTVECGDDCDPDVCPPKTCGICPEPTYCIEGNCACELQCEGKTCGADGCGGLCGTCNPYNEICTPEGQCECKPKCSGPDPCGDDGCGGSCGACFDGAVCNGGQCCQAKCTNKQCGDDGCGSQCGTCPEKHICDSGACVCVPQCAGKVCGADGCGSQCGECFDDWQCIGGQCKCVPDCTGKECGDDGCNGSCGACADDLECSKIGLCTAT